MNKPRQEYVVGFMFSTDGSRLLMIRKNRPAWMNGLLNGVGGKIEGDERPLEAMVREFREETGVEHTQWDYYGVLKSQTSIIYMFRTTGDVDAAETVTDEQLEIRYTDDKDLIGDSVPNMSWLIPYMRDPQRKSHIAVEYA